MIGQNLKSVVLYGEGGIFVIGKKTGYALVAQQLTWILFPFSALIGSVFGDEKDPAYGIGNQCVCIGVIITTGLFQFACVKSLVYIKISLWAISIITYGIFELYYKPRFLGGK